jgi:pimeloyl-ACP methyl ester carboxylesterase
MSTPEIVKLNNPVVDTNVDGVVIKGKGHWLMEEAPAEVIPRVVAFIKKSQ